MNPPPMMLAFALGIGISDEAQETVVRLVFVLPEGVATSPKCDVSPVPRFQNQGLGLRAMTNPPATG